MPFRMLDQIPPPLLPLRDALDPGHPAAPPQIRLRVYGGMPSERLDFTLRVRDVDSVEVRLIDRLHDRAASRSATPGGSRLDVVRGAIARGDFLRLQTTLPAVLPDSVIGELRMTAGPVAGEWRFVADTDQADAMGDSAPLALVEGVAPLMTLGKELLELEAVSPQLLADAPGPIYVAAIEHGADTESEHVVLYNLRREPLQVAGLELRDNAGNEYRIPPGTTIAAHGVLRIWTGEGVDHASDIYQKRTETIWNNPGDVAAVVDASGQEIARRVYRTL